MGLFCALCTFVFLLATSPVDAQELPAEAKPAAEGTSDAEAPESSEGTDDEGKADAAQTKADDVQSLRDAIEATKEAQKTVAADAQQAKVIAQTLAEQIDTPGFPKAVRRSLLQRSAAAEVQASLALSRGEALREGLQVQKEYLEKVVAESEEDREARELAAAQELERQRLEAEASQAEEQAVEALEKAREMESHEHDETLRELLARQRKAAEETLALTRSHRELMDTIRATAQSRNEAFAEQKGDLLARIDSFPDEPTSEERRDTIDPLFRELIRGRAQVRGRFKEILKNREEATTVLAQAEKRYADAKQRLERVKATKDNEVVSEIYQRRVEAAEAEYAVAEKALNASREVFQERQKHYEESERRLAFYREEIPSLLPKISKEARRNFFELSDQNLAYAIAGLQEGVHHIVRDADMHLIKPSELNLFSIDLWRWVWGLVWRIMLVLILVRALVPRVSTQIARGTDALLKRKFFREHAHATVRASDALDAIAKPLLYFLGARFLANYILPDTLLAGFSALIIFRWWLDSFFIYWALINLAQVIALPRWYRRKTQNLQTRLDLLFMEVVAPLDPANDPQLKRGKKLVRSVRVILFFWLISTYVPDAARLIIGVSIFTWVLDFVARWSLFGIIYWVLSTWKDDIAAFFESLAGDRMPRAVEVVNTRKDRFYGVFIIAAASVYVLGSELMRVARKYMLNTEWFRHLSTLMFRAKIELRNREEESADETATSDNLPDDYLEAMNSYANDGQFVVDTTTCGDLIAGAKEFERMTEIFDGWLNQGTRGSMVIVGEPGSGKSTILREFEHYIDTNKTPTAEISEVTQARTDANLPRKTPVIVCSEVTERIASEEAVLKLVADLFDLKIYPGTTQTQLLDRILGLEPRVILVKNCHALFLRQIGGFNGLQAFFNIISASDRIHFYALTFNVFAWSYVNRVRAQSHYFTQVFRLRPWTDREIQELIESRTSESEYRIDFSQLLQSRDPDANPYDVAALEKTARGYFRYLQEFCGGNPRLAITYWLRSLRLEDTKAEGEVPCAGRTLQVGLFRRPSTALFAKQSDADWFVLTAIAQHGHLSAAEIAQAVHLDRGFCELTLRLFAEADVVRIDPFTGQASLTPLYYRQVLKYLAQSNFLYE
ncbi:hypothetical protein DFR33_104206 [Bradymonas sediminis]|uniref:Uncharacterized protein n=2 Tax=Bradymonas sediminis TaxID=1548548 RepID=A0A2Z4FPU9_9DELT|nr:hypothetical protein DN745_16965 [Bradymonas sediminis]TDP75341.1 hypothetical protein DFR33_104206 [Bradymonas sediminis]